ncbi:MAG: pyridoxal-phosphate-dependent aminotransferase family protein [Nitrososphaeria archaeon]|jgi:alanine-glyoxylate transaminase/serine-glyoxylate transaminase/serine-pyruvate transaminase
MTILTPGPTEMNYEVLKEMLRSVNPDLDEEFFRTYRETADMIRNMIGMSGDVYIMSGEGMLGLEAAIANTIAPGDRVLALSNGVFGESFADLARRYGASVDVLSSPYDEPFNAELIEDVEKYKAVTFVYVETPSGLINDIVSVSEKIRGRGPLFIVDAVSAVGGVRVNCEELGVDICLMASQKAFSSPPGLAIVAVSKRAKEVIERTNYRGYYMSIKAWDENLAQGMFPYTPAANDILALHKSLKLMLQEGLDRVYRRHEAAGKAAVEGIKALGLKLFVKDERYSAPTVTAVYSPVKPDDVLNFTWRRLGVMLAGSWGPLRDKLIRIGHMGYTAQRAFVAEGIAALGAALNHLGIDADITRAVKAVNEVFDSYGL